MIDPVARNAGPGLRPGAHRQRAFDSDGQELRRDAPSLPDLRALARWPDDHGQQPISAAGACNPETGRCDAAVDARESASGRARARTRRGRRLRSRRQWSSPDGKRAAFIRDYNLWVRDVATGQEKQLTTRRREGLRLRDRQRRLDPQRPRRSSSGRPTRRRSRPSSRTSATSARCTSCRTIVGHPELEAWKYPLPGDSVVAMIQRVIIDVDARKVMRLQMPPDQHRSTLCDDVA